MAVHQVLVDAAGGLVEAGVQLVEVAGTRHGFGGDIDDALAVWGEFEALDAAGLHHAGERLLLFGFHVDRHDVVVAAEKERLAIQPYEVELALGGFGELGGVAALGGNEVYLGVALVLVHAVVGDGVSDQLAVGGDALLAHLA